MTRALDCSYYFEVHILELFSMELRGGRKEGREREREGRKRERKEGKSRVSHITSE